MNYYFNIAGIVLKIQSEIEIRWNAYIKTFEIEPVENVNETYICKIGDRLDVSGNLVYQDQFQQVYIDGANECRLHYFYGQKDPCMLYQEHDDRKIITLNKKYLSVFQGEDTYQIFNAIAFEKVLIHHQCIGLHCAYIIVDGQAILFTAPSGTGKSTQADLWKNCAGATIVNGDRAIIKKKDGNFYACGLPICGSSNICLNMDAPISTIVYLYQNPENVINPMRYPQRVKKLISEVTISPFVKGFTETALDLISELALSVDVIEFGCTKYPDAVETLKAYLRK